MDYNALNNSTNAEHDAMRVREAAGGGGHAITVFIVVVAVLALAGAAGMIVPALLS